MNSGDMLYFWGEDTTLMVVMANETGIRYYDVKRPQFKDDGSIVTTFATYETLDEVCSYMTHVDDIEHMYMNRSSKELNKSSKERIRKIMGWDGDPV